MSFSSNVKEELSKTNNLANKKIVEFEFFGYLISNQISIGKNSKGVNKYIKFSTDNEYNINRFNKLLSNLSIQEYDIETNGKTFAITIPLSKSNFNIENKMKIEEIRDRLENEEIKKAIVRGAFLGGGSINNPKDTYRLIISFKNIEYANLLIEILNKYEINFKILEKKQRISIYVSEAEQISKFLAFIGANNAVIKFEEIRVYKEVKNQVNRKVNCETANLSKTVETAIKQIEEIKYLKKMGELEKLPKNLQEIAEIRLKNPQASLQELGQLLPQQLGKSGVNHRLNTIEKIAKDLKEKKEE